MGVKRPKRAYGIKDFVGGAFLKSRLEKFPGGVREQNNGINETIPTKETSWPVQSRTPADCSPST